MYIALTTLPIERFIPGIMDAGLTTMTVRGQGGAWSDFHRLVIDGAQYPDSVVVLSLDDARFVCTLELALRSHIPVAWIYDPNAPDPDGYQDMLDRYQESPIDHGLDPLVLSRMTLPQGLDYDAYLDDTIRRTLDGRRNAMLTELTKQSMAATIVPAHAGLMMAL